MLTLLSLSVSLKKLKSPTYVTERMNDSRPKMGLAILNKNVYWTFEQNFSFLDVSTEAEEMMTFTTS